MKLRRANPNSIGIPEVRVTARFDEETLEQFRRSMATTGQVAPIICSEIDGQLVLVDGLHRLQEAIANKAPYIEVAVIDGDMTDVLTRNIYLDHLRGKTPPSEMVKVIEVLVKDYGMDFDKLAEKTGLSRDYIDRLYSISQLTPMIRAGLDEEKIKVGHASALTRLKNPVQQETVYQQLIMYHWTVKELEAYITDVLAVQPPTPTNPAEPAKPVLVRCFYCGDEYDPREGKIANPNTCQTCAGTLLQAIAQARAELAREQAATEKSAAAEKSD